MRYVDYPQLLLRTRSTWEEPIRHVHECAVRFTDFASWVTPAVCHKCVVCAYLWCQLWCRVAGHSEGLEHGVYDRSKSRVTISAARTHH